MYIVKKLISPATTVRPIPRLPLHLFFDSFWARSHDTARPCQRCVKRGIADTCTEGHRKRAKYLLDEEELGTSFSCFFFCFCSFVPEPLV